MAQIKVIFWDIDGTLLNFEVAEESAIRKGFAAFGLGPCSDAMLAEYSTINRTYWQRLERGEITKQAVLEGRFQEFFSLHGLDPALAVPFNAVYQRNLGDTVCFYPYALETVQALRSHVLQFAATNGTKIAQDRKLARSGLGALLDGVLISEEIGAEKPDPAFFAAAAPLLPNCAPDQILMVGDSLTSDMQLANNVGLAACWYNPKGLQPPAHLHLDYIIQDLRQVPALCGLEESK